MTPIAYFCDYFDLLSVFHSREWLIAIVIAAAYFRMLAGLNRQAQNLLH
jgi:hypothetical protein